jgi:translation elongation factor P/translation initiation factor 5A
MEPKTYKVTKIDGDYAHLMNVETGEDLLVARALLPEETDEGVTLYWENFVYTVL